MIATATAAAAIPAEPCIQRPEPPAYRSSTAVASWSQLAYRGPSTVSISTSSASYNRSTSRTWQPYSSADHTPGDGRRRVSRPASTCCHASALARIIPAIASRGMPCASPPHCGQRRCAHRFGVIKEARSEQPSLARTRVRASTAPAFRQDPSTASRSAGHLPLAPSLGYLPAHMSP